MGKTCSGKDTIAKELIKHGFHRIITYTTRPRRKGEVNGKDYHFITDKMFKQMISDDSFAEYKFYNSAQGTWWYGSVIEDFNKNEKSFIILTPSGYKDIINKLGYKPKSVYISAANKIITERLKQRGDNPQEANRRLVSDNKDFLNIEKLADMTVFNNFNKDIEKNTKRIIDFYNNKEEKNNG